MAKIKGVFLSDLHMPEHINLNGVVAYIKDLQPDVIILGGDIIDGQGMFCAESMPASAIKLSWFERDKLLLANLLAQLRSAVSDKTKLVFIAGNHENRYCNIEAKYPDAFKGRFDFQPTVKRYFPNYKWIPYNTYSSFYKVGDCIFTHGRIYPENHAKKYAQVYIPNKVVYGHLHSYQAFTIHNAMPSTPPRYAVNGGCLTHISPEWKKGAPNMWLNGFVSFVSENGVTVPTVHLIERGKFNVGPKEYK